MVYEYQKNDMLQIYTLALDQTVHFKARTVKERITHEDIIIKTQILWAITKYLIYTSAENRVPLLVPLECKYWPFVLSQGACQIS